MIRRAVLCALAVLLSAAATLAPAWARSDWDGVERIVVIGDLEGDYEKFEAMLADAGLINGRGNWSGGEAHLVQLGDVPDRGPNSRAIMDHLMRLERQARRAGGRVHALIGNHEAMNVEGDLRYVHPGEYAAFAGRDSERLQDAYYAQVVSYLTDNPPDGEPVVFDDAFRAEWEASHPLGFVEHRQAWSVEGEYGEWVAGHESVVRINDTLFLHGGIGPAFSGYDRETMNTAVQGALEGEGASDPLLADILWHEDGPLWYRGLALHEEAEEAQHLADVLARHGVKRIVLGHTKRAATVFPRFDGQVVLADIAVPGDHSDPYAYLVIEGDVLTTVHRGTRVRLRAGADRCAYLAEIAALDPPGSPLEDDLDACLTGESDAGVSLDSGE